MLLLGSGFSEKGKAFAEEAPQGAIIVNGDEVEYFPDEKKVMGKGNISIDYKGSTVTADAITVFLETKDAEAEGEVILKRGTDEFRGSHLTYNFETKEGVLQDAKGVALPWYFGGVRVERHGENAFLVKDGYLTTCDLPHPHYKIHTKQIEITAEDRVIAKNVFFEAGGLPVLYAPYYSRSIKGDPTKTAGVSIVPGYSSRWGAYALGRLGVPLYDKTHATLIFDERTKRGPGGGAEIAYETNLGEGEIKGYFIDDDERQSPIDTRKDTERYRGSWKHRWEMTPQTTFLGEYHNWSDRFITRDYFNNEYTENFRPETFGAIIHNNSFLNAALMGQKRTNHFFTQTEQLPEFQLTSRRLPLWDTGLFYQGEANVGSLTRAIAGGPNRTTERADLFSELSYPTGLSGIQFVPKVGIRQTYYGKDLLNNEDVTRGMLTTGFDLSTRFRKMYDLETHLWGWELLGLRHIVEPGIQYRYTPEPTLIASRTPFFDDIDLLTKRNRLTFILDNKFQTQRVFREGEKEVVDLIDLVLESHYDFKSDWEGKFVDVVGTLEFRPSPYWGFIADSTYDVEVEDVVEGNMDLFALREDRWRMDFLYRYEDEVSNQITSKLSWKIHPKWKVELYERFEADEAQFEEEEIVLTRNFHCWEASLGFNVRDTEDRERPRSEVSVYLAFRLTAFPGSPVELGNRAAISRRFIGSRRSGQWDEDLN